MLRSWYEVSVGDGGSVKWYFSGKIYHSAKYKDGSTLKTGYIHAVWIITEGRIVEDFNGKKWLLRWEDAYD